MGAKVEKDAITLDSRTLTDSEIHSLMKRTGYSRKQIETLHNEFLQEFPIGFLDQANFIRKCSSEFPFVKPEKFSAYVFQAIDSDKNNEISFVEFITAFTILKNGDYEEKLRMIFNLFDINKNGIIEKHELEEILHAFTDMTKGASSGNRKESQYKARSMMNKYDTNKDSCLSFEEFADTYRNDEHLKDMLSPFLKK